MVIRFLNYKTCSYYGYKTVGGEGGGGESTVVYFQWYGYYLNS